MHPGLDLVRPSVGISRVPCEWRIRVTSALRVGVETRNAKAWPVLGTEHRQARQNTVGTQTLLLERRYKCP